MMTGAHRFRRLVSTLGTCNHDAESQPATRRGRRGNNDPGRVSSHVRV